MSDAARIVFEATVDERGKLRPVQANTVRVRLARWNKRKVLVTIARWRKPKTLPQLGYYYGVMLPMLAEHHGYDEDEMHVELKRAYFPKRAFVSMLTGEAGDEVPSLAEASSEEMSEYMDRVIRHAAEHGLRIPAPHEEEFAL